MAIYTIGDLHLSLKVDKPMDVFGGWHNYTERIENNWKNTVSENDTVVLIGDTSWGMNMDESRKDFLLIDSLPGRKIISKGNHDYWWASVTSMHNFFDEHGITTIDFLHNNSYIVEDIAICGSRGWIFEDGQEQDAKIVRREAIRLENSLSSVKDENAEKVVFIHYPPVYGGQEIIEYIEVMQKYDVKRCYYGHVHGHGHRNAVEGLYKGIDFTMVSSDYVDFTPVKIN